MLGVKLLLCVFWILALLLMIFILFLFVRPRLFIVITRFVVFTVMWLRWC
mgnify:CR=1 FL=1